MSLDNPRANCLVFIAGDVETRAGCLRCLSEGPAQPEMQVGEPEAK